MSTHIHTESLMEKGDKIRGDRTHTQEAGTEEDKYKGLSTTSPDFEAVFITKWAPMFLKVNIKTREKSQSNGAWQYQR